MSKKLTKLQANSMWDSLRQHFTNAADTIKKIIEARAWEPLGYTSFTQAWNAEMRDVTLAKETRAHIVYQLLEERVPVADIADMVGGVAPLLAESFARQKNNGVPADCAVVSEHLRRRPKAADTIHVRVGATLFYEYRRVAALNGETVEDIAREAIRERFAQLVGAHAKPKRKVS
jgi:hypothetical protein